MRKKRKIIAYLLSMVLMLTSLPVQLFAQETTETLLPMTALVDTQTTTPGAIDIKPTKYIGDGYEVEFKVTEQKEETFTGKFALTNTGTYDIEDWSLQFDFQHEILDIQNANILEQDGTQCILQATSNTNTISQGQTIEIIFEATYSEFIQEPTIYILDEEINYQNCPEDEEAYKIWKENILKKEQRKRNNSRLYEMSMFAVTEPTTGSISNEYIQFNYLNGYHGVVTTGGNPDNPNDDNKLLIYGGGSTSYTTIRIDGNNYEFSPDTVTRYDNKIIGTKRIGDVIVSQHIGIIPNQYTGRDDVVEFFYTVENTSDTPHDVGVRIMFDTMLGNNDSAPFRLPAVGDVTTETDLSGEEIPEFWQAFDNLTNPKVIAQGTLKVDKASTPDRVRFTNWRSAVGNPWDYVRPAGSSNGDSAVCLYWNEQTLEKDDTLACKTFYGLSALQQDLRPPLALALTGATKLEVVKNKDGKEEYSPNPFTVTAYIENIGTGTATNTKITLNLPQGMEVVNGQNTINLGNIPVGTKQHQVSWKVNVAPSAVDKVEEYSVTLVADNAEAKTLKREITVPKLQTSSIKLYMDRSNVKDGNQLNFKFKIVNEGEESIDLSQLCARYYFLDENPNVAKQISCDVAKIYPPYKGIIGNISANVVQGIVPTRKNANAYIEFGFDKTLNELKPNQEMTIVARLNNVSWTNMIFTNDYSYIGNGEMIKTDYVLWPYMPIYDIKDTSEPIFGIAPEIDNSAYNEDLLVEFKADKVNSNNNMSLSLKITNTGILPVNLEDLNLKYYYTNDSKLPQSVKVNSAFGRISSKWITVNDKVSVKVKEMNTQTTLADNYVDMNFGEDTGILGYEDYIEIQFLVYNTNWQEGTYILNNDHSFQTKDMNTSEGMWQIGDNVIITNMATGTQLGNDQFLNYTVEINPKEILFDRGMKLDFRVSNTGDIPINLSNLNLQYFYTKDYNNSFKETVWYQACDGFEGGLNVKVKELEEKNIVADTEVEIEFPDNQTQLEIGQDMHIIVVIGNGDFSNKYDVSNDFSYLPFAERYINLSGNEKVQTFNLNSYEHGDLYVSNFNLGSCAAISGLTPNKVKIVTAPTKIMDKEYGYNRLQQMHNDNGFKLRFSRDGYILLKEYELPEKEHLLLKATLQEFSSGGYQVIVKEAFAVRGTQVGKEIGITLGYGSYFPFVVEGMSTNAQGEDYYTEAIDYVKGINKNLYNDLVALGNTRPKDSKGNRYGSPDPANYSKIIVDVDTAVDMMNYELTNNHERRINEYAYNPQTGERKVIPADKSIEFKQEEYDGLISFRYQNGSIPDEVRVIVENHKSKVNPKIETDIAAWLSWVKRKDSFLGVVRRRVDIIETYFYADYTRDYSFSNRKISDSLLADFK